MTQDGSHDSGAKETAPVSEAQSGNTVRQRLVLTIFIVLLMAVTSVASVYRQEIYVFVVRTATNLLSSKVEHKNSMGSAVPVASSEVSSNENKTPKPVEQDDQDRVKLDTPPSPSLSLAAEVARSVVEDRSAESSTIDTVQSASASVATPEVIPKVGMETTREADSSTSALAPSAPKLSKNQNPEVKPEKEVISPETKQAEQKTIKNENPEIKAQASTEQFQVPGSLTVRIENYSGSLTKWRLMVILDDSGIMAKNVKPWDPDRFACATGFVSSLAPIVTHGSKLAVRDFACIPKDEKVTRSPCLSRMLLDWSDAPYSGLKERLKDAKPGGSVNPCAAAAYSMKKDFLVSGAHSPRLLLVTAGGAKCDAKAVLKAAGAIGPNAKTPVDVLAIGMKSKKKTAYSNLAKKTGGVFLTVDSPADLDNALKKYSRVLHITSMEKIEIRGDKVVFSVNFDEDITLAPGTYTVVLPSVKGLAEFKRSVPNVRIKSGEATLMTVKLSKGKATVKIGPK